MQHVAEGDGFRHVFFGWPNIGGRYSVLSDFGLVPAAAMGVDVAGSSTGPRPWSAPACRRCRCEENPGRGAGDHPGHRRRKQFGRDKLTILASPGVASLGAWLEQLIAESTGKQGMGIIPIDREVAPDVDVYGSDRMFVHLRLPADGPEAAQDGAGRRARAGGPSGACA